MKPKEWEDRLTLFVGYLIQQEKQSSTIKSYISAIKAILREDGIKITEDQYLISSLTKACKIKNDSLTVRFPIQKDVLRLILTNINNTFGNQVYLGKLYRAMYAMAYYGLFRVGEITKGEHPILARNVHLALNKRKLLIYLESSKMDNKGNNPQIVKISAQNPRKETTKLTQQFCPFKIIGDYIVIRPGFKALNEPFSFLETDNL